MAYTIKELGPTPKKRRYRMQCPECGGTSVCITNMTGYWNEELQVWVGEAGCSDWCDDCEMEIEIEEEFIGFAE